MAGKLGAIDTVKKAVGKRGRKKNGVMSKGKDMLLPAALSAAGTVAMAKGPDLVRKIAGGGSASLGEGIADKLGNGGGTTRRLPIERWTDVAVPIETAYQKWTEFERFPSFMHRVLNVEEKGRDKVSWDEKIWFSKRHWEGRITDRRKNDRIAWQTTNGMQHRGVVSFHELDARLTRVMVTMEFEPTGVLEKLASGLRFVKRAVEADLARFKAYVELDDAKGIEYRSADGDDESGEAKGDSGESEARKAA